MDQFNKEESVLNNNESAHKGEGIKKIQQYERLHGDHQNLQKENIDAGNQRKKTLEEIQADNNSFDQFAKTAIKDKRGLRDNLADLEDSLRRLKDQLSNITLDNKNLQLVVDTEAALKTAKANAEVQSVTTVNKDLKTQVDRLQRNIQDETDKKGQAKRILDDLTAKHAAAQKAFEQLLAEIEKEKKRVEGELDAARKTLTTQTSENSNLQNDVTNNEKTIQKLSAEILSLTNDINALKAKNEHEIQILEKARGEHEKAIVNFKNNLTKADHDHEKLKILLKKAEHEI